MGNASNYLIVIKISRPGLLSSTVFLPIYIVFILCFAFSNRAVADEDSSIRDEHGINHEWVSPNKKLVCKTLSGKEGFGQELILRNVDSGTTTTIWTSVRWIEVSWAPNSQYLAVIDHYDGQQSAVLIFNLHKTCGQKFCLIYQTLLNNTIQEKWSVKEWVLKENSVLLEREERLSKEPWYRTSLHKTRLNNKCLVPSIYEDLERRSK